MKREDLGTGLAILNESGVIGVSEFSDSMVSLWLTYFHNIDGKVFIQSCMRHIAQSRYFPSIAEILELCLDNNEHISVDQIWLEFKNTTKDERDPLITEAFKLAGINKGYCRDMTMDTAIRYAKPSVERVYKKLLEEEKKSKINDICDNALISYNANNTIDTTKRNRIKGE